MSGTGKTAKEQEIKPEKTRGEKMVQVISELFEQLHAEKTFRITPQQFYEIINVNNHQGLDDLTKSLKLLEHFTDIMQ